MSKIKQQAIINANPLSIENIGKGNLIERFQLELEKVLANIADTATGLGKREINIKITVAPGHDRDEADFEVDIHSKLAPKSKYTSTLMIGTGVTGKIEAHESISYDTNHLNKEENLKEIPGMETI